MKLTPDQCKTQEDVNAAYEARNADILARHLSGESPRSIAARYEILHTSIVAILKKMGQKFVRAEQQSDDEKELRERVRRATYVLIKKGELARQACEVCGDLIVECHHERYDARWMCDDMDGFRADAARAMRATLTAKGIPVTPEAGK